MFDDESCKIIDGARNVRQLANEVEDFGQAPGHGARARNNLFDTAQVPASVGQYLAFTRKIAVHLVE